MIGHIQGLDRNVSIFFYLNYHTYNSINVVVSGSGTRATGLVYISMIHLHNGCGEMGKKLVTFPGNLTIQIRVPAIIVAIMNTWAFGYLVSGACWEKIWFILEIELLN